MILPLLLLSGVGLFTFFSGKGSCYGAALTACKEENAHKLFDIAARFRKKGDARTAEVLTTLGMRMQSVKNGATVPQMPTYDPDQTGNPALAELGGVLWNLETRLPQLHGWAAAYNRAKLPAMTTALSSKGAQIQALYPASH